MKGGQPGQPGQQTTGTTPVPTAGVQEAQPAALAGFSPGIGNGLFGIAQGYNGGMGQLSTLSSLMNPQNPSLAQGGSSGTGFPSAYPAQMSPQQ
jgi:hypothetical protein